MYIRASRRETQGMPPTAWSASPVEHPTPLGPLTLRIAKRDELVPLRHAVLRTGLPSFDAHFPGDELPTTLHLGAFTSSNQAVCCATYVLQPFSSHHPGITKDQTTLAARRFEVTDYESADAHRLRGMATDADYRGAGVGQALLRFSEQLLRSHSDLRLLWCDARLPAIRFYENLGWRVVSDRYFVPTAGPHHRMLKPL
jgi:GNAT superfamily N-acetyltransferase